MNRTGGSFLGLSSSLSRQSWSFHKHGDMSLCQCGMSLCQCDLSLSFNRRGLSQAKSMAKNTTMKLSPVGRRLSSKLLSSVMPQLSKSMPQQTHTIATSNIAMTEWHIAIGMTTSRKKTSQDISNTTPTAHETTPTTHEEKKKSKISPVLSFGNSGWSDSGRRLIWFACISDFAI